MGLDKSSCTKTKFQIHLFILQMSLCITLAIGIYKWTKHIKSPQLEKLNCGLLKWKDSFTLYVEWKLHFHDTLENPKDMALSAHLCILKFWHYPLVPSVSATMTFSCKLQTQCSCLSMGHPNFYALYLECHFIIS